MTDTERAAVRALATKLNDRTSANITDEVWALVAATGEDAARAAFLYVLTERYARLLRAKEAR